MTLALFPFLASSLLSVSTVFPTSAAPETGINVVVAAEDVDEGSTATVGGVSLSAVQVYAPSALIGTLDASGLSDGTYDVVLTRSDATSTTLTDGFEVLTGAMVDDTVQLLAVVPGTATVGRETEYTVIGANFDPATTVTFEEFRGPKIETLALTSDNVGTASAILVAGTVDVIVERPDGSMADLEDAIEVVPAVSTGDPVTPSEPPDTGGCAATGPSVLAALAALALFRRRRHC